jgi:hypothetical protein
MEQTQGEGDVTAAAGQADAVAQDWPSGRAKVRALLIEPLVQAGLQRPKGKDHNVDTHAAFLDRLQDRLSYLDADLLVTLQEVVLTHAEGPARNLWPALATIINNAHRLRQPPDDERHIMTTWLRSIEGPRALEGGYLVELHSFLRKHGRPPSDFDMKAIRLGAAENQRRVTRVAELIAAGRGDSRADDLAWLDAYRQRQAYCEALVRDGAVARAARQMAEAGQ